MSQTNYEDEIIRNLYSKPLLSYQPPRQAGEG